MRTADLARFVCEREATRINKENDRPKPWTGDAILQQYRFCNVRRENDAVTRWLRRHWYPHFKNEECIGFAAVVARLLNQPESLVLVKDFIIPWKPAAFIRALQKHKKEGGKVFNAAYIVSTNGIPMDKIQYITERVLGRLWAGRKDLLPISGSNGLERWHAKLMEYDGLGSFLAAQVVADMKYIAPLYKLKRGEVRGGHPTTFAGDWWTFAASGPGSRRGLNRVIGNPPDFPWAESVWRDCLTNLRTALNEMLSKSDLFDGQPLHAQDVQNCLCEFDKYERVRLGEGTPKQKYPGGAE